MFLFGRACVSGTAPGTLLCLEIQKTFISKAGWAVALSWQNIWIDGIRPSTVLKNIESCLISVSVDRICMLHIFKAFIFFHIFWRASIPVLTGRTAKISKVGKAVPLLDSHKTQPFLKQQVKIKIQLQNNQCQPLYFSTGLNVHAELLAFQVAAQRYGTISS